MTTSTDFENWVNVHKDKIYRIAYAILLDESLAKDVLQEVLINIWQRRNSLHKLKSIEAWYTTVTKNKCINELKKKQNFKRFKIPKETPTITPSEYFEAKELKDNLDEIMTALTDMQRAVLHLKENELLEYKEIGKRLGISESNVKIQVYRSRQFIAQELKKIYDYGKNNR
jgi:RNA polymerase sigma-70 factor (ECF subfamily)